MNKSIYEGVKISDYMDRKKDYQRHLNKLSQISNRKMTISQDFHLENYHLIQKRARKIKNIKLNRSIELDNKKLIDKIVDISTRAVQTSFDKHSYTTKHHHHAYYSRLKSYNTINIQNPKIFKRIAQTSAQISRQQLSKSFQQSSKIKSQIQRFPYLKSMNRKLNAIEVKSPTRPLTRIRESQMKCSIQTQPSLNLTNPLFLQ